MKLFLKQFFSELENLYAGWVYNPTIGLWNGFVDFHNQRVDQRRQPKTTIGTDETGTFVRVGNKRIDVRERWFEEDMRRVLAEIEEQGSSSIKTASNSEIAAHSGSERH